MDILSKLRIVFWGLIIGIWGLFMYQYMSEDMSLVKKFRVGNNPFTGKPESSHVERRTAPPPAFVPPGPAQPQAALPQQGSLVMPLASPDIKDVASSEVMPMHTAEDKAAINVSGADDETAYPATPEGFARLVTRHFVIYEEGKEVSKEISETVETLHGSIMLDLVAFSPWTREKKVFIFFSQSQETYRRITGRPGWSGGAASLSERKIYLYKSDEAFGILAHELTHIYFDSFFTPSNPSPLWLSEGLATYVQSERGNATPDWLAQNLKLLDGGSGFKLPDLVRIENLSGADEDNIRLWYAQSYSVTRFLMKMKSGDAFYLFCKGLRDGVPASQALYRAYGMPYNKFSSLEYAWRYDLKTGKISDVNR
ncbi:MAG TPA: hypothetical protein DCZ92_06355 [Elusimicrobia bacterium]|nr:MAG: hypothetical protein A2016_06370 [Elusimicrobia bacterium GWF2_62_30]HBA60428.1 hypothetical protein [Elusimicrobiota bacterium]